MIQWSCTNDSFLANPNANFLVPETATRTERSSNLVERRNRVSTSSSSMIWKVPAQRHTTIYKSLSLRCHSSVRLSSGRDKPHYFDSGGACWSTRTPAIRAGLNDRSQSAYAAPAPKPVERAIGHARPGYCSKIRYVGYKRCERYDARRKRMTDATTPTLKPMPLHAKRVVRSHRKTMRTLSRRTTLLVNPPLLGASHGQLSMVGMGEGCIRQRSYCASAGSGFVLWILSRIKPTFCATISSLEVGFEGEAVGEAMGVGSDGKYR
jgi:hypothetical protein